VTYRYAREPKTDMTDAKRLHRLYTDELQRRLAAYGFCSRLEYTGSAYEGVKVGRSDVDSDLEFDIMVILRCGADLQVESFAHTTVVWYYNILEWTFSTSRAFFNLTFMTFSHIS